MASDSIPLHCNICPKKPNFSDVSHLLTHIASKGHLSHYYKVKVRSASEDASRRLIEAYDQWYAEWRVEDLMSDRMSMKERKKTRSRAAGRALPGQLGRSATQSRSASVNSAFDPRLMGPRVKDEPRPTPPPMLDYAPYAPHFDPRMRFWPSASPTSFGNTSTEYDYHGHSLDGASTAKYYPDPNTSAIADDNDNEAENDEVDSFTGSSECTKLKGVYWPGMNIFDSATPEMRRKRNQKKDVSVVEMLESNSQEVEPNEMIFTPRGSFKRQRRISGSSFGESSPMKSDISDEDVHLSRPALMDIDPNILRVGNKSNSRAPRALIGHDVFRDNQRDAKPRSSRNGGAKKRKTFAVYQDEATTTHTTQTTTFNYLTSEFHYPQPAELSDSHKTAKSLPATSHGGFPTAEKENYGNATFPYPTYYGAPFAPAQHYPPYAGVAPELPGTFYSHSMFYSPFPSGASGLAHVQDDDQRTITAPPSEN